MAQGKIEVTFQELMTAAQDLEGKAAQYRELYLQLFDTVKSINELGIWQGSDSAAFADRVERLRNDFLMMENNIRAYASFVRKAAETYENGQKHFADSAGKIHTGI